MVASYSSGTGEGWWLRPASPNYQRILAPLIQHLAAYDEARRNLEDEGGPVENLKGVTALLAGGVVLRSRGRSESLTLTEPDSFRSTFNRLNLWDVHLQVRRLRSGMPGYELLRTRHDYWHDLGHVTEDLYRSPAPAPADDRFVSLFRRGRETPYLRLSPFRRGVSTLLGKDSNRDSVDEILFTAGRDVFQGAWSEDQKPTVIASATLGLPALRHAAELIYAVLSCDLYRLGRWAARDGVAVRFFQEVYRQPYLAGLIAMLRDSRDGVDTDELRERAMQGYRRLSDSFKRLLNQKVSLESRLPAVTVYQAIFSNVNRAESVSARLKETENVRSAAEEVERIAAEEADEILGTWNRRPGTDPEQGGKEGSRSLETAERAGVPAQDIKEFDTRGHPPGRFRTRNHPVRAGL